MLHFEKKILSIHIPTLVLIWTLPNPLRSLSILVRKSLTAALMSMLRARAFSIGLLRAKLGSLLSCNIVLRRNVLITFNFKKERLIAWQNLVASHQWTAKAFAIETGHCQRSAAADQGTKTYKYISLKSLTD